MTGVQLKRGDNMYNREIFKQIKHIVSERLPSSGASTDWDNSILNTTTLCGITGWTTRSLGQNFQVTITATTGKIYAVPESTVEPTSTNAFTIDEGGILDIRIKNFLSLKGNSTTAKYQAIVWTDES